MSELSALKKENKELRALLKKAIALLKQSKKLLKPAVAPAVTKKKKAKKRPTRAAR